MQSGNVLPGYREGSIEFPMTYKFKPGTSRYSGIGRAATSSSKDNINNNESDYENDFNDDFDDGESNSTKADDKEERKRSARRRGAIEFYGKATIYSCWDTQTTTRFTTQTTNQYLLRLS